MAKKITPIKYTDDNVHLFISRFTTGSWAYQGAFNPDKGITPYVPGGNEHLTPELVRKHLNTEMTLGSYAITPQNSCKFLVIDFDVDTVTAKAVVTNPGDKKAKLKMEDAMKAMRVTVADTMKRMEEELKIMRSQMLIEKSGVKGYHIWMFFEEEVPSIDAYKLTRVLANELDLQHLEIYPKQPSLDSGKSGSLIKLPLSVNRKNMAHCLFLDDGFEVLPEQWIALAGVEAITTRQLGNLIKLNNTELDQVEDGEVRDIVRQGGSLENMISKCAVLSDMKNRADAADGESDTFNFSHDERLCQLSLFRYFGMAGKAMIHALNSKTHNYDYDKCERIIEESDLKPMTCITLQTRGICLKKCENIAACNGKSPIALSTAGMKRTKDNIYTLKSLADIESPMLYNKPIRVDFTVNALMGGPYHSTKKAVFDQCTPCTCPKFEECDWEEKGDFKTVLINETHTDHIEVFGEDSAKVNNLLRRKIASCAHIKHLKLKGDEEKYSVQPFSCSNVIKLLGQEDIGAEKTKQSTSIEEGSAKEAKDYTAFYLGSDLETSKAYRGFGIIVTNPQNQMLTMLFSQIEPLQGQIDNFEITASNKDYFEAFKAMSLPEIIKDFRDNITYIYGRDELILSILLTHFSVLKFSFNNVPVSRGWVELAIIGDTGQAKSTLTERILNYIGLGRTIHSNASVAGVIGGINKLQNLSYVQWGAFPRAHKSLLFMDEVQNFSDDIWKQLRTARSLGIAKIDKIITKGHEACVRLICAANPKPKDKELADFRYGAQSLASILDPADIRRFDLACFMSSRDLDKKYINSKNKASTPRITAEMAKAACLWAWSRKPEHIIFTDEVVDAILDGAKIISTKFGGSTSVPLCNASDMREKLARLTVALAALQLRTEDRIHLVPVAEDVKTVCSLLSTIYSHPSVALDRDSEERMKNSEVSEEEFNAIKMILVDKSYEKMSDIMDLLSKNPSGVRTQDAGNCCGVKPEDISKIFLKLTEHHLIGLGKGTGVYVPLSKLSKVLTRLRLENNVLI